ncbi:MAG: D-alanyl-D-alanine carboxypeptidase family protein [Streptosporangiaceae bacterium]
MRHPLPRTLALAVAAVALTSWGAQPAHAARWPGAAMSGRATNPATNPATDAVGGSSLARHGTVAHRAPGVPKPPHVRASAWLVADAGSGAVLAAKDAHGTYRPASTLKILTAVTLIPRLRPGQHVHPTRRDCAVDGSKVGLVPSMRYRVDDLFRGMLLPSGNDAALALAHAAGGTAHTVRLMNQTARNLRAYDTVAKTPNGLDAPGQHTSAYDLALMTRAGLEMPRFRKYVSTVQATFPAPHHRTYQIQNHNRLLTTYDGAIGVKTGYTTKARGTYVGAAHRGGHGHGHTIVVVLLHAYPDYWTDARQLLTWGFRADTEVRPVGKLVAPVAAPGETPDPTAAAHTPDRRGPAVHDTAVAPPRNRSGFDTLTVTLAVALVGVMVMALAAVGVLRWPTPRPPERRRGALPGPGSRSRHRRRG